MATRFLSLLITIGATLSCSLAIDRNADQCSNDHDCARFAGTTCDMRAHLCALLQPGADGGGPTPGGSADAASDPGGSCIGVGGCYACLPSTDTQYGSACTDAKCRPFDNRSRLTNLLSDGGLAPLPGKDAQREAP
jgi:hypothetical protein